MIDRLRRALAGPHPLVLRVLMDVVIGLTVLSFGAWAKSWAVDVGVGNTKTSVDVNTIILAIISLIGTVYLAKINNKSGKAAVAAETTKAAQAVQTDVLKEVHVAVNSSRTILEQKVERLEQLVLGLTTEKAALLADARNAELAKAGADAKALADAEHRMPPEATAAAPLPTGPVNVTVVNKEPVPVDVVTPLKGPTP